MREPRAAMVVGAGRGIGLAICRVLLQDPATEAVIATFRDERRADGLIAITEPRLLRFPAEVTDPSSLDELARSVRGKGLRPSLVIHAAGILHESNVHPEKSLQQCEPDALERLFAVNSIGPLLLARAIIPLMPRRRSTHFAALSAMVGSIGDNRLGGWYGYRASKAALNQFLRTLAIECRRTHPGMCVTAIHPGTTDTGLSRPFQANVRPGKLYAPERSARRIVDVVVSGTPEESGRFVNWDGRPIPW